MGNKKSLPAVDYRSVFSAPSVHLAVVVPFASLAR